MVVDRIVCVLCCDNVTDHDRIFTVLGVAFGVFTMCLNDWMTSVDAVFLLVDPMMMKYMRNKSNFKTILCVIVNIIHETKLD